MAFPMGVVWTVQPFWSHHPRYPLPEVRVAAPCVDGDFRVEACSASAVHSTQTSVWLYLQPHHAPHLFAEGPAVRLAIWRIWAAFANSQMLKQTQILRPICTDCLRHLRHLLQRGWCTGCCIEELLTDESYSTFSSTQSLGTVQKSPGISSSVSI